MKYNKWTLGLAALGAVSLASVSLADEKMSSMETALASTTLSGYVDTSAQWNLGTGNSHAPAYKFGGAGKADGFNLDVVKLTLEKPMEQMDEWGSGYKVDLLFGPDANTFATQSGGVTGGDFAIKQAYVALRTPCFENGVEWKIGVFDSVIGYESFESTLNPNYTRSWAHQFEPSTHTGILSSYRVNRYVKLSAGIGNTVSPAINGRANPPKAESYKGYMGSLALTAPDEWGFLAGSSLYGGVVNGYNAVLGASQINYYVGTTFATPIYGLRCGLSYDYAGAPSGQAVAAGSILAAPGGSHSAYANSVAGYSSIQASETLSFHFRAEYASTSESVFTAAQAAGLGVPQKVFALTSTAQFECWKNVISRLEFRWDHALDGRHDFGGTAPVTAPDGSTGTLRDSFIIAANVIYRF